MMILLLLFIGITEKQSEKEKPKGDKYGFELITLFNDMQMKNKLYDKYFIANNVIGIVSNYHYYLPCLQLKRNKL